MRLNNPRLGLPYSALIVFAYVLSNVAHAQSGEALFRQCASCHVLSDDGPARVGPHLAGVVGRAAAGVDSYRYSDALNNRAKTGLIWTQKSLDQFLQSPAEFVAGTKMGFTGIKSPEHRTVLIEWLIINAGTSPSANEAANNTASETEPAAIVDPEVEAILSQEADADYGEYLAGECLTCHQVTGATSGVPPITGLEPTVFVRALLDYKNGVRANVVMQMMAGNLGREEMASLALFFSTLE